ncbi:MAG: cation diffusion facilitator family transporter [Candidatus Aenigmarchaeota archaeon]|nr:cation diffusion facilitator family transporter [Candidatus Aenigmarchaeota archaeon]
MDIRKGQRAAKNATIITALLAMLKAVVGLLSGSLALLTDALHSTIDIVTISISFVGLKIAGKRPTKRFPYGYYKAESLAVLFISLIIFFIAFRLLLRGYYYLFFVSAINFAPAALSVALISSAVSFLVARYLKKTGEEINSQALLVNSQERKVDALSSIAVFVAILSNYYEIPYIEGSVVIVLASLILKIGIISMRDSVFALMDVSPSKEIENKIKKILKSIKGVESFENLRLRKAGPFIFGEVIVKIKKFVDVAKAHEIADNIENKIKEQIKQVDSFTVHVEPFKTERQKILVPVKNKNGLNSEISEHFSRAEYFIFVLTDNKKIKSYYFKANPFKTKKVRTGISVTHYVIKEKIDTVITKEIGEISFHALRDGLVDVYKADGKRVGDIINNFIDNKLTRLKQQTREKD